MQRANSLERPWCCERLKAGGEGDDRGPDGWMASLTQWRWAWASCRRWWRTGKPGVLQPMGSQRVTEWLNSNNNDTKFPWSQFNLELFRQSNIEDPTTLWTWVHLTGLLEGFPCGSDNKESARNAGDPGLIPGSGRSLGEGNDNPLQYSCLENSMDR